jgi:hypothetical protein
MSSPRKKFPRGETYGLRKDGTLKKGFTERRRQTITGRVWTEIIRIKDLSRRDR